MIYLKDRGLNIELATYDKRLADAATASGIALATL
jgi:hypothetical protein